jgi:hypothetical protein
MKRTMQRSILSYVTQLGKGDYPWLQHSREPASLVTPIVKHDGFNLRYGGFRIASHSNLKDYMFRDASLMRKALDYLYLIQLK